MLRHITRNALRIPLRSYRPSLSPRTISPYAQYTRKYSTPTNDFDDLPSSILANPLFQKMTSHPDVTQALQSLMGVFETKGLLEDAKAGKPFGMWQMMQMASDGDVKNALMKVKDEMTKAGITPSPEEAAELLDTYRNMNK